MSLIRLEDMAAFEGETAVCLGTFDGVHLGHQALVSRTVAAARAQGLIPCAYTFDLPPASVFRKDNGMTVLSTLEEKATLLHACGIELVAYSHFDRSVAEKSARAFFEDILVNTLHARHIVIGFHYHFGQKAQGDAEMMRALCREAGIGLSVVPPVRMSEGELVSSTAIREYLRLGDRAGAEKMLNRTLSAREEQLLGGKDQ